ncbi:hypothetical protein IP84_02865 [beta proteobacterium AAP99]|nr:hypothetical protein IP84_02865 [beta proteobacterium AAP99]
MVWTSEPAPLAAFASSGAQPNSSGVLPAAFSTPAARLASSAASCPATVLIFAGRASASACSARRGRMTTAAAVVRDTQGCGRRVSRLRVID